MDTAETRKRRRGVITGGPQKPRFGFADESARLVPGSKRFVSERPTPRPPTAGIAPSERRGVLRAATVQFLLLTALYSLRPLRDALGVSGGSERLPWLFTATFLGMLALTPLFGVAASRLGRGRLVSVVYRGCAVVLVALYGGLMWGPHVWSSWIFFVWISIFNMFAMSLFWSVMSDRTPKDAAKRLFGPIFAGASLGAILGPSIAAAVAKWLDPALLLLVAAVLLELAFQAGRPLWNEVVVKQGDPTSDPAPPLGGRFYDGLLEILRIPRLQAICLYLVFMTAASTVVYLEQGRLIEHELSTASERTVFLAGIDLAVNVLALIGQAFIAPRVLARFGLSVALIVLPLTCVIGFVAFGVWPGLAVLALFQVARRASDYGLSKPAREVLFTDIDRSARYKAKNLIDTVVYRGSDAFTSWVFTALAIAGLGSAGIAFAMVPFALGWAWLARWLGKSRPDSTPSRV